MRQTSSFRNWITPDGTPGPTGEGGFKPEPGRYRLYVGAFGGDALCEKSCLIDPRDAICSLRAHGNVVLFFHF